MGQSWYDRYCLSPGIDKLCGGPEVMKLRAEVVPLAEGTVLELGLGSGLNLAFYDPQRVTKVLGVDPGVALTDLAQARMAAAPVPVELLSISGEALPQADHSIDTVLTTFTSEPVGLMSSTDAWGKRSLAYPIKKNEEGYYIQANFELDGTKAPDLERAIEADQSIIRHLLVRDEVKPAAEAEAAE